MATSQHLNMIALRHFAKWEYPTIGNVLTGQSGRAVAVVCDGCIERPRDISFAVETRGDEILYHLVTELEQMPEVTR